MGSFSILNNIAGLAAQNQLNINNVNLTKYQILVQGGISALAQANQNSQSVLSLLRNQ
jgi:flagellin-like hook-associated protein FlgL